MKLLQLLLAVTTTLALLPALYSAREYVYIQSTSTDAEECSTEQHPCYTLDYYVQNADIYFRSDTTVILLGGIHTFNMNRTIVVKDIKNLVMQGNNVNSKHSTTVVQSIGNGGFAFINITSLQINDISFHHFGRVLPSFAKQFILAHLTVAKWVVETNIALLFTSIHSLVLSGVSVQNCSGFGILGINIYGNSTVTNSEFLYNNYNSDGRVCCRTPLRNECYGGNIAIIYADPFLCPTISHTHHISIAHSVFSNGSTIGHPEFYKYDFGRGVGAAGGLMIMVGQTSFGVAVTLENVTLTSNLGYYGANMFFQWQNYVSNSTLEINNSKFKYGNYFLQKNPYFNAGYFQGAGLYVVYGSAFNIRHKDFYCPFRTITTHKELLTVSQSEFSGNIATKGSAINIFLQPNMISNQTLYLIFRDVHIHDNTGLFSVVHIRQYNFFANRLPFALVLNKCIISSNRNASDTMQDPAYMHLATLDQTHSTVALYSVFLVRIIDCEFTKNQQTALYADESKLYFEASTKFVGNSGVHGGGMSLRSNSLMFLSSATCLTFIDNYAEKRGGGLYVKEVDENNLHDCFFQTAPIDFSLEIDSVVVFLNNSAGEAGSDLYGGSISNCIVQSHFWLFHGYQSAQIFHTLFHFESRNSNAISRISSDPFKVCSCDDSASIVISCDPIMRPLSAYPGALFKLPLVLAGLRSGTVPGVIHAEVLRYWGSIAHLGLLQEAQEVGSGCKNLTYSLFSIQSKETVVLQPERTTNQRRGGKSSILEITLLPCPPGFQLANKTGQCVCSSILQEYGVTFCNISDETIHLTSNLWISTSFSGNAANGVMIHQHCPFDYCKSAPLQLNLKHPDKQCALEHSGILCGGCNNQLSLVLGSSLCQHCSNKYLALLIPFAIAGLCLVVILIMFNLTVSVGTINGLIFYANILRVNHTTFFPSNDYHYLSSVFIAWLNLDLGIETCLYNGMNAYVRTWLQFAFPLYLWIIVGSIIVLSRYSSTVVKVVGSNAVPVLGTLFLLSYTKLQRTIISTFSFTFIQHEDGTTTPVWLYDGNVPFLKGTHGVLFTASITTFVLVIVPFTLLVLFSPCLQSKSNHSTLSWIHRFKPLIDAYQSPYKDKFRYWTGLMLVIRNILLFVFALNTLGDPSINLATIVTVMLCLLTFTWFTGDFVYKKSLLNFLEMSFLLNLGILSVWTLYARYLMQSFNNQTNAQVAVTNTSVGIAFFTFIGILTFHIVQSIRKWRIPCFRRFKKFPVPSAVQLQVDQDTESDHNPQNCAPTFTVIELSQLRESLLTGSD